MSESPHSEYGGPHAGYHPHRGESTLSSEGTELDLEQVKAKYIVLKTEHRALREKYERLRNEYERDINAKNAEIQRLKKSAHAGSGDTPRTRELTDEVQRLLTEKVAMQTELSRLRFELAGKSSTSLGGHESKFEEMRLEARTRAEMSEKDREIATMQAHLADQQAELDNVRYNIVVHNDQQPVEKKKKTWWGGTKKSKSKNATPAVPATSFVMPEGTDFDLLSSQMQATSPANSAPIIVQTHSKSKSGAPAGPPMVAASHLQAMSKKFAEKSETMQAKILDLERSKAKADAEVEILERERLAQQERLNKLEAMVDALKTHQRILDDPDRIPSTKSLMIPIPPGGGDEADRWRVMVQIQEAALRKEAIQRQELQHQLQLLTILHDPGDGKATQTNPHLVEKERLEREVHEQAGLLVDKATELTEANSKLKEAAMRESYLVQEVQRCKTALLDLSGLLQKKNTNAKKSQLAYTQMLAATMAENEKLQDKSTQERKAHREDVAQMFGEVRALREGRVGRMKGSEPSTVVWPSPAGQMGAMRHEPRRLSSVGSSSTSASAKESAVVPSASSSSSSAPSVNPQRYYYEWVDGKYVLKESRARSQSPQVTRTPHTHTSATHVRAVSAHPIDEPIATDKDRALAQAALKTWNASPPPPRRESFVYHTPPRRETPKVDSGNRTNSPPRERSSTPPRHRDRESGRAGETGGAKTEPRRAAATHKLDSRAETAPSHKAGSHTARVPESRAETASRAAEMRTGGSFVNKPSSKGSKPSRSSTNARSSSPIQSSMSLAWNRLKMGGTSLGSARPSSAGIEVTNPFSSMSDYPATPQFSFAGGKGKTTISVKSQLPSIGDDKFLSDVPKFNDQEETFNKLFGKRNPVFSSTSSDNLLRKESSIDSIFDSNRKHTAITRIADVTHSPPRTTFDLSDMPEKRRLESS